MAVNDFKNLRRFNFKMGVLHFVQGAIMLTVALSVTKVKEFKIPIFSNYLTFDTTQMQLVSENKLITQASFGILVAVFLFLSAFFHFLIVSKKANKVYEENLKKHYNPFRWYEYALSSSLMICLIGMLFGIYDIGSLILLFTLNATMNLFGLLMEKMNLNKKKLDWTSFIFGSIAGFVCWVVLLMYAFGNSNPSEVPWFVYAVFMSYFVFFNLFPVNMYLQYKKIGKWKNYLYGERGYIILSLVAKSLLAWLVFFGVMQP